MAKAIRRKVKGFEVILHPENGIYWVECPQIQGCYSQGDTIEETLKNMQEAIELHLEVLEEENQSFSKTSNSYLKPSTA